MFQKIKTAIQEKFFGYAGVVKLDPVGNEVKIGDTLVVDNTCSLEDWWERSHKTDNIYWISGTDPKEIWSFLQVETLLNRQKLRVLNIGVGKGFDTIELFQRGHQVDVLDISAHALVRVEQFAKGYLASDLQSMPSNTYDLVLSHLVIQHMSDEDVKEQFKHVTRALKPNGLFAFQFIDSNFARENNQNAFFQKSGGVSRSVQEMRALLKGLNATEALMSEPRCYDNIPGNEGRLKVKWYACHLRKNGL